MRWTAGRILPARVGSSPRDFLTGSRLSGKKFDGLKALLGKYVAALKKTYTVPVVADPK